jgi:hypothetical protein
VIHKHTTIACNGHVELLVINAIISIDAIDQSFDEGNVISASGPVASGALI